MVVRELITLLGFSLNDGPLKKYDTQIASTKEKTNGLAVAARGIGTAFKLAAAVAVVGAGWISKNIIGVTAETERYRVVLGTMIGDQEKANKIIHDLDYSPVSDFYGTAKAIGGLQGMVTFGMQAEEASDVLTRIGDIAQGNSEAFVSMSNTMGQVFAKGKADSVNLKQFVMQGFDVVGEVAKQTGKSREEIQKTGVTYAQTAAALKALTSEGGKYHGMLAKQMNTVSGIANQFKSLFAATGEAIGIKILEPLKDLLRYVLDIGRSLQDSIVDKGGKALKYLIHVIAQVIIFFEVFQMRLRKMGVSFEPLKGIFQDVFGLLLTIISAAVPILYNLAAVIIAAFKPIQAFLRPVIKALKPIIQDVFGFAAEMIGALVPVVQGLMPHFEKLGERIGQLLDKVRPVLKNIMAAIKAAFEPIKAFVMPIIEALKPVFMDVFNTLSGLLDGAGESTSGLAGFIEKLTPVFRELGEFVGDVIEGLWYYKDVIMALVVAYGIWTAAQWALNAAAAVNPITWIILGIVALIFAIYELIKHWDKIGPAVMGAFQAIGDFFVGMGQAIAGFFTWIWSKITSFFASVVAFVKKNLVNIVNVVLTILFPIAGIVMALVRLIIKHWDTIKGAFTKAAKAAVDGIKTALDKIVNVAKNIWDRLTSNIHSAIDGIKGAWKTLSDFMSGLWDKIKNIAVIVWEGIKAVFFAVVDAVKAVWLDLGNFFSRLWEGIKTIASAAWSGIKNSIINVVEGIKNIWRSFAVFLGSLWNGIKAIVAVVWDGVKSIFFAVVDGIKNAWQGAINFIISLWEDIKEGAGFIWEGIKDIFWSVIEGIKTDWQDFVSFLYGLWEGIKEVTAIIWDGIKGIFFGVIEGIKTAWQGFAGFFTGLWEAMKEGPAEALEYIKNAFFGLFEKIQEKFTWFIDVIRNGWEKVKGFFGGIGKGVVNFFTGGDSNGGTNTNPGGTADGSSTEVSSPVPHPPAFSSPTPSLTQAAAQTSAARNTYNSSNISNNPVINSSANISVNVPPGTSAEQAQAISRQVYGEVQASLADAIGGARGLIPSPEARRY